MLDQKLAPDSVVELGCGPGHFLKRWVELGVPCMGFDGCSLTKEQLVIPEHKFQRVDLTTISGLKPLLPLVLQDVDLLFSLEMLEHWPVEHDHRFFELIRDLEPKWVILSAARPGQQPMPGETHPNCQEVDEVIAKMVEIGYVVHDAMSDLVRHVMLAPTALLQGRPWADFYQRNTRVYWRGH
jgi:trans-aconitate methyltransferase